MVPLQYEECFYLVRKFARKMGFLVGATPRNLQAKDYIDRHHLMTEELSEYLLACASDDLPEILDALVDLQYLLLGTAIAHGLDQQNIFEKAFIRVHLANMKKTPGVNAKRELLSSDAVKPPGWKPADVASILEQHNNDK